MKGKNFKILELNGAKSEPAHIYHPGFPISEAYKVVFEHCNEIYTIAQSIRNWVYHTLLSRKDGLPGKNTVIIQN